MLPLPFENHIPYLLRENMDDKGQAFVDKVDSLIEEISQEVLEMYWFKVPYRAPADFLNELGAYINANITPTDSERTKRSKIENAVKGHKLRGTWEDDAKLRIDAITSLDAVIIQSVGSDDWILVGDGLTPSTHYWATMGADGIDLDLGLSLIGAGDEIEVAGNIYINLHDGVTTPVLTQAQVDAVVFEIDEDVVPAYYRVHLGYMSPFERESSGQNPLLRQKK